MNHEEKKLKQQLEISKIMGGSGPAFPLQFQTGTTDGVPDIQIFTGLSKREHIAAIMLQGFCANPAIFAPNASQGWKLVNCDEDTLATYALTLADSLIERLKK